MLQAGLSLEHGDIEFGIVNLGQDLVLLHPVAPIHLELLEIAGDLGVECGSLKGSNRPGLIGDPLRAPPCRLDDLRGGYVLTRRARPAQTTWIPPRFTLART